MKKIKSIQEIFTGRFAQCRFARVHKCDKSSLKNSEALRTGYTSSWGKLEAHTELVVLVFKDTNPREIWVGKLLNQIPDDGKFGFVVDKFDLVGVQSENVDAIFYNTQGGGSHLVKVERSGRAKGYGLTPTLVNEPGLAGEMLQRFVWLRRNHAKFHDPVWNHWGGRCAVTRSTCNHMLVASHIKPWSLCKEEPEQRVDVNNGLLLSVPIDAAFDRGLISFSDNGDVVRHPQLTTETARIFGIRGGMGLDPKGITPKMRGYLKWHRAYFRFA